MRTEIVISESSTADAKAILELQKLAYRSEAELYRDFTIPPLTQSLEDLRASYASAVFLKACSGERIVGSVRAEMSGDTCRIGRLIVHPDFQRRGIGTRLMEQIEAKFAQADRYELFTGHKSFGNIRLYQRLGYH